MYNNEKGKEEVSRRKILEDNLSISSKKYKQKLINHSSEDRQGYSLVAISFRFDENSHSILVLCVIEVCMVKGFM